MAATTAGFGFPSKGGDMATTRFTPATLRRDHAHVGRRHQRELSARHVAGDAFHRDVPVSENDAGVEFNLEVAQRLPLRLGEAPHLLLREG